MRGGSRRALRTLLAGAARANGPIGDGPVAPPCDVRDAAVLRRKVATASLPPGIAQICPAALGS